MLLKMVVLIECVAMSNMNDINLRNELRLIRKPQTKIIMIMMAIVLLALITTIDTTAIDTTAIKTLLLIQVMLYVSYYDMATKRINRYVHIIIVGIGELGITTENIMESILGLAIMPLPLILTSVIYYKPNKNRVIGNGDIYYAAALGFAFGITTSVAAMFMSMIATILCVPMYKRKYETIAFGPIMSVGYMMAIIVMMASVN